jgi:hypothetical protein
MTSLLHNQVPPNEHALAPTQYSAIARQLRSLADAYDLLDSPTADPSADRDQPGCDKSALISARIRGYLAARRRRDLLLGPGWFSDPVWDMLLDLLASQHEGCVISIGSACIAASVPTSTALRWLQRLVEVGAIVRIEDEIDHRRVNVVLAPDLTVRLEQWVARFLPLCS